MEVGNFVCSVQISIWCYAKVEEGENAVVNGI